MPNYFIDSHCHLFNIEDIPLYSTLANVKHLPSSVLALAIILGKHKSELDNFKAFIDQTRHQIRAHMPGPTNDYNFHRSPHLSERYRNTLPYSRRFATACGHKEAFSCQFHS